jgi:hypothetical protein
MRLFVPFGVYYFRPFVLSSLFTIRCYVPCGFYYFRPFVLSSLFTIRCYVPYDFYYFRPIYLLSLSTIRRFVLSTFFSSYFFSIKFLSHWTFCPSMFFFTVCVFSFYVLSVDRYAKKANRAKRIIGFTGSEIAWPRN